MPYTLDLTPLTSYQHVVEKGYGAPRNDARSTLNKFSSLHKGGPN